MKPLNLPDGALRAVAIGAHPDDIEIGCGGTLLALSARRDVTASVLVLTGTPQRVAETDAALHEFLAGADLGIRCAGLRDSRLPAQWDEVKDELEDLARLPTPDIVFAPKPDDAHQDHRLLGTLVPTVWRDSLVMHYEIPKWDGDLGRVDHYVGLEPELARRKVELLDKCFPSQHGRDLWTDEVFLGLMRLRGVECRRPYAEGFVVSKCEVAF